MFTVMYKTIGSWPESLDSQIVDKKKTCENKNFEDLFNMTNSLHKYHKNHEKCWNDWDHFVAIDSR